MKIPKILISIFVIFVLLSSAYANSNKVNDLILGKTLSDVIYEMSEDIIENRTEIISINISKSNNPFIVKFVSDNYATSNNISCDDGNCTLFGQYVSSEQILYILPESINDYYNFSIINETLEKISNTFIHELAHHYQYEVSGFSGDMINSLEMDATYVSPNAYILNNYGDYQDFNLSDIPSSIVQTINFPNALSTYTSGAYVGEIQARLTAVCLQEKKDYAFYWDMIEVKDYEVCQRYVFPMYLDNIIADDLKYFVEAYMVQYLGLDITESKLENVEETTESIFIVLSAIVGGINFIIIPLAVMSIVGIIITGMILMIKMFGNQIGNFFKSSFKK